MLRTPAVRSATTELFKKFFKPRWDIAEHFAEKIFRPSPLRLALRPYVYNRRAALFRHIAKIGQSYGQRLLNGGKKSDCQAKDKKFFYGH
jgi:hypothetical protein